MRTSLTQIEVHRLLASLTAQLSDDDGVGRFFATVLGAAFGVLDGRVTHLVDVHEDADALLAKLGDQLPNLEDRRDIVAAALLDAAHHGLFGSEVKVLWIENN
jgi:ABC-type transporter Mla subunit MlaD